MANPEHVAKLEEGPETWNKWRDENGGIMFRPDLEGADLWNANFQSADLRGANLQSANLSFANLESANLSFANIQNANLFEANLQGAKLHDANLQSANLWNANLESADLRHANLQSADLEDANLESAILRRANLENADLQDANLQSADLRHANLKSANLFETNLQSADLFGANLESANLRCSQYWQARFWNNEAQKIEEIKKSKEIESLSDFLTHESIQFLQNDQITPYFRGESNEAYHLSHTLGRSKAISRQESLLMTDMMTRNPDAFTHKSHFANMVVARHHGLPNRLLDVTRNPLVALFNATEPQNDKNGNATNGHVHIILPPQDMIKPFHSDTISILANFTRLSYAEQRGMLGLKRRSADFLAARDKLLHFIGEEKPHFKERFNYGDFLRPFIVEPQQSIDRVKAQSGAFIISALHHRFERNRILGINPHIPCYGHEKFIVPAEAKEDIRKELKMLNITEETLMADLDSSAKAITERYSS